MGLWNVNDNRELASLSCNSSVNKIGGFDPCRDDDPILYSKLHSLGFGAAVARDMERENL